MIDTRVFIVDTNVVAAGLITNLPDSPVAKVPDGMLNGRLVYLLSPDLLDEYRQVLLRPKLVRFHGLTEQEIEQILTEITANVRRLGDIYCGSIVCGFCCNGIAPLPS